jgi:membrane protein DedA with SNARE-associated domain
LSLPGVGGAAWKWPDPMVELTRREAARCAGVDGGVGFDAGSEAVASAQSADASGIVGWATSLMEALGAPGAGLAIAVENFFPPLPSEVILPLAGLSASQGDMSLVSAIACTTLGSVVGALVLFGLGAWIGRDRVRAVVARVPLVDVADLDKTEAWFARHGGKAVFFGRMIPVFRSLISIPAGVARMPITTFLAFTAAGSLIWNTAFVLAGYQLGDNWRTVEGYVGMYSKGVLAITAAAVCCFVAVRLVRSHRTTAIRRRTDDRR